MFSEMKWWSGSSASVYLLTQSTTTEKTEARSSAFSAQAWWYPWMWLLLQMFSVSDKKRQSHSCEPFIYFFWRWCSCSRHSNFVSTKLISQRREATVQSSHCSSRWCFIKGHMSAGEVGRQRGNTGNMSVYSALLNVPTEGDEISANASSYFVLFDKWRIGWKFNNNSKAKKGLAELHARNVLTCALKTNRKLDSGDEFAPWARRTVSGMEWNGYTAQLSILGPRSLQDREIIKSVLQKQDESWKR